MTATAFGKPVEGEINYGSRSVVEQRDPSVLQAAYERLFEFPQIKSVSWAQYTPYFNDGDECIFGVNELSKATLNGAAPSEEDDEWGDGSYAEPTYTLVSYEYDRPSWTKINLRIADDLPEVKALFDTEEDSLEFVKALLDFDSEIQSGAHDVFLKKTFGDHAEVTATREGFSVDYYGHD